MKVGDDVLAEVRDRGFSVVSELLSAQDVEEAQRQLFSVVPRPEAYLSMDPKPSNYQSFHLPFGGSGTGLSRAAAAPQLIDMAERFLGTNEILITRATVSAKYPGQEDHEQDLHVDYRNNVVDYPRNDRSFLTVDVIVYLSDVDELHGPTYAVPFEVAGDDPVVPVLSREEHPDVYAKEVPVVVKSGGALVYTQSTLHRGSHYFAREGGRFALHLVYKAADAHATSAVPGWAHQAAALAPEWGEFVAAISPRQRQLFGFRPPGHPYWNRRTVAGVGRRYPLMDMTPYERGLDQDRD